MNFRALIAGALLALAPFAHAADVAISALPAGAALAGTEAVPAVQSGSTVKTTPAAIKTYTFGTINGIVKANGSGTPSAAVSGTDYAPATSGSAILKGNGSGGFSSAASGTDYAPATSGSSILKGNGSGAFSNAASGTDYAPATSGSAILKGNGSGGFSNATSGTDYAPATSGTTLLAGDGSGGHTNVTGSSVSGANITLGGKISVASGTVTASAPSTLTQTWNNSGVTFEGLTVSITDTASASDSRGFRVSYGGTSAFSVYHDFGGARIVGAENGGYFAVMNNEWATATNGNVWTLGAFAMNSTAYIGFASGSALGGGTIDTRFIRGAAGRFDITDNSANLRDMRLRSLIAADAASTIGYATGAGGAVTQIISRTTGVTLNKSTGAITLFTAAGSATAATFTVTNSQVAATDTISLSVKSGTNKYLAFVTAVGAGTFDITFYTTGGTSSDAPAINFNVIKGANS